MAAITRDILGAWSQISGCLGCSSLWLPAILSHLTVFHFYNSQSIKCRRALWDVVKMFKIPLLPSKETNQSQFSVGAFLHLPPAQTAGTSDVRGGFVSPLTQPLLLCLGVHPGKDSYRLIKKKKKRVNKNNFSASFANYRINIYTIKPDFLIALWVTLHQAFFL